MKNATNDMTVGSPWKHILAFALPVFFSNIFQQLYNTADSLIVGRCLGTEALAAVSSSGALIFFMISFFTGTAVGGGVVISKYFGAKDNDRVSKGVHTAMAFAGVAGVIITLLGIFATPVLLKLMNTDADVMPEAIEYFRVYFAGSFFVIIYNMATGVLNAVGNSRRPLIYLVISSVLNIILDTVFIAVFGWGVWSAAFATVISQLVSALLATEYLMRPGTVFRLEIGKLKLHGDMLREILRYGIPSGIQNSVIGFANLIVQTNINSFGKIATAAYGSYSKIEGFAFLPVTSFTMALTTFTGQNLGAREYDRAKKGSLFGIVSAVSIAEVIGLFMYISAPFLIGLFTDDAGVIEFGVRQTRIECFFFCLLAFSHSVAAVCRGAGKAFVPMIIMLSVWCVFRIIYIEVIMYLTHELSMIYWAYPITWSISSVIYVFYYFFSDWIHGFDGKKGRGGAVS